MQYENMIGLIGTLKQIEKIDEVNGLSFNGYKAIVTTERTSGAKDDAIVLITEETMRDNRTGLPKEGEAVMIAGSVQTHKNFGTGKVGQYIPPGIGQGMEDAMPQLMEDTESALQDYADKVGATTKVKLGVDAESVGDMVSGSRIVSPQSLSMSAQQRNTERVAGNTFTQNVNITSNRELSPAETARQTRIATRQMIAAIARG